MAPVDLYFDDPYRRDFDAVIKNVSGDQVELSSSYFFPRGGGQVGDSGTINGAKVKDTEYQDGRIIHIMESVPVFQAGDNVRCLIDWDLRYRRMRLHSASHIVYYIMMDTFGDKCKMASSGLLDELKERSDYMFDSPIDRDRLKEVEERANVLISGGHEIKRYRDPSDPTILWWEMDSHKMKCCGTHPANTREIGKIVITRGKKPGKGRERIEITLE
jgi:alanyl-tRNA synthetase